MKVTFEWDSDHLCCNGCPFVEWEEDERLGFFCSLTDEQILRSDEYDFNNPDERHEKCPLKFEETQQ